MSNLDDWHFHRNLEKAGRLDDVFRALRDAGYDPVGGEAYGDYVRDLASERDRLQEEVEVESQYSAHIVTQNDRFMWSLDEEVDKRRWQQYITDLLSDTAKHLEAERQSWKGLAEAKDMALDEARYERDNAKRVLGNWEAAYSRLQDQFLEACDDRDRLKNMNSRYLLEINSVKDEKEQLSYELEEAQRVATAHFYDAYRLQGERDQAIYASRACQNMIDCLEGERDKARGEWKGAEDALEEAREEAAAEGMARRQADNTLAEIRAALNDMGTFSLKRIERADAILDHHYGYVDSGVEDEKQGEQSDPDDNPLLDVMRDVMNKINAIHGGESEDDGDDREGAVNIKWFTSNIDDHPPHVHICGPSDEAEDGENHATFQVGDTVRVSNPRAYADYQGLAGVVNAIHHFPTVYPIQVRFPDRSIRDYSHDELSHTLLVGDSVKVVSNEPGVGHKGEVGTVYKIANTDWAYPVKVGFSDPGGGVDCREYGWHELERV